MAEYLITFNDEWVPEHSPDELSDKAAAARAVLADMKEAEVLIYTNGGLDASTAVFSVEARGGEPVFTDGAHRETAEHLGGFCVIEAEDDDQARYWAGRLAVALDWPQEVHRYRGPGHMRG